MFLISNLNIQHNVCKKKKKKLFLNHLQFFDELKQLVEEGSCVKIVLERKEEVVASAHRAEEEQQFVEKPNPSMWHSLVSICFKLVCARTRCALNEAFRLWLCNASCKGKLVLCTFFKQLLPWVDLFYKKDARGAFLIFQTLLFFHLCGPLKNIYK